MNELDAMPEEVHSGFHREHKIKNDTIRHLLWRARRVAESWVWNGGLLWSPEKAFKEISPDYLARQALPKKGTAAYQACVQEIRDYTGKDFSKSEAVEWLLGEIQSRLDRYILQSRSKIEEVRLIVRERSVKIKAERPDTTFDTVGPAPFSYDG
jgi:hypothetical protein